MTDTYVIRNGERILAAPADRAAACRGCGRSTPPNGTDDRDGWRRCQTCAPWLAANDHGRAWATILGDPTVTTAEGAMLTESLRALPAYVGHGRPSEPGHRKPWTWVPRERVDAARAALRRHRDNTSTRAHKNGPCCLCGRRRDDGWAEPMSEGRDPVCGRCAPLLGRHGWPGRSEPLRDDVTTALALGIRDPWYGLGRDVPVRDHRTHHPGCPGHDDGWEHLDPDDRATARIRLARRNSRVRLTDDEKARMDREDRAAAVAAEAARLAAPPARAIVL